MDMNDVDGMPEDSGLESGVGYGRMEADEFVQLPEGEMVEVLREQGRNKREMVLNELFPLADYGQ